MSPPEPAQVIRPAYQQRVVDEMLQLRERYEKLTAFIQSGAQFERLDAVEQKRMRVQASAMYIYGETLNERIHAFRLTTPTER